MSLAHIISNVFLCSATRLVGKALQTTKRLFIIKFKIIKVPIQDYSHSIYSSLIMLKWQSSLTVIFILFIVVFCYPEPVSASPGKGPGAS